MYLGTDDNVVAQERYTLGALCWSINEVVSGDGSWVELEQLPDGAIRISDDGAGMDTELDARSGRPGCEVILTALFACHDHHCDEVAHAICEEGALIVVVNALSTRCDVTIHREGHSWQMVFEKGSLTEPLKRVGPSSKTGTSLTLWPDKKLLGEGAVRESILDSVAERVRVAFPSLKLRRVVST